MQKKKEGNLYVKKIQSGVCAVHGLSLIHILRYGLSVLGAYKRGYAYTLLAYRDFVARRVLYHVVVRVSVQPCEQFGVCLLYTSRCVYETGVHSGRSPHGKAPVSGAYGQL